MQGVAFVCTAEADLYRVLADSPGPAAAPPRFDTLAAAVGAAVPGSGILVLADGYPERPTGIDADALDAARKRGLRLYLEFAAEVPGLGLDEVRRARHERAVVAGKLFGDDLPPGRILAVQGLAFQSLAPEADAAASARAADAVHLVAARVAGFDHAVYGLPAETAPLLLQHPEHPWLVATTCLSRFVSGRYAPADAWAALWRALLGWVAGDDAAIPALTWQPPVAPAFARGAPLPDDVEACAVAAGTAWYYRSGLLVRPDQEARLQELAEVNHAVWPEPGADGGVDRTPGDGSHGLLEGQMSILGPDGAQLASLIRRSDCTCEGAFALAMGGDGATATNLLDFVYETSPTRGAGRRDPAHPAYGHLAWGITNPNWLKAHYGDDNARDLLGTAGTAGLLSEHRWDEAMALCLLANLRTSSVHGFRPGRIDLEALEEHGWEPYFRSDLVLLHPHYEAYLWACFLWAYERSGDELFYRRAHEAIRRCVEAGPSGWRWTNGLAQERARMLLPLAWLVRVADTDEHRRWLRDIAAGVLALQDESGAVLEELGDVQLGSYPPPPSNEAYGEHEASLIQADGDPVADLLYTTNFAFLGLHEAAAATDDAEYRAAADRLAAFLCRCQARSTAHPELDGAWFRAFDARRWEAWGSNADAGWGAWAVESGWTQGWITAVLALRQQGLSLWALAARTGVGDAIRQHRETMIPAALEAEVEAEHGEGD